MAKKITQEQMLEAIKGSQGLVSKIQRRLEEITHEPWNSWETVERYIHKWESCEQAIRAEKEAMLDLAENNIFKELAKGDTATSKWYLRMKGKERGYIETQEIQMANKDPLNINLNGDMQSAKDLIDSPMVEVSNDEGTGEE